MRSDGKELHNIHQYTSSHMHSSIVARVVIVTSLFACGETYLDKIKLPDAEITYYRYMETLEYPSTNPRTPAPCGKKSHGKFYWCLPDLYFIGVSKGGTSSMAMHLNNHHMITNVRGGGKNEGHFFDTRKDTVMSNVCPDIRDIANRSLVMDFTPNYLSVDNVPKLLRAVYTDEVSSKLRFIIAIRDPISRAVSSWLYKKNSHPNLPSFVESMSHGMKEGKCVATCFERNRQRDTIPEKLVQYFAPCDIERCVDRVMSAHVVKSM